MHGVELNDPYAWLRADNWQEVMQAPETLPQDIRDYLETENDYTKALLAETEGLQDTLFDEMKGRIKEDESSVPSPDGPFSYQIKYVTGAQHPRLVRFKNDGGDEEVLLDGDKEAGDKEFFKLAGASHSPDHSMLSWAFDDKGSEYHTLRIRNTKTGEDLADEIALTGGGGGVWSADNSYVFYVRVDENHRPSKLFRHKIGEDPAQDILVFEEKDPGFFMGLWQNPVREIHHYRLP